MFGHSFYHETLRKYVIIFGTLFNEIYIERKDTNGNVKQKLRIPLAYGPRDKTLARLEQDPNLDTEVAITLPRMSFEMSGLQYAPERKLNTVRRYSQQIGTPDNKTVKAMYQPVPYDVTFELSIFVNLAEDGTKIIEQIMPFFTPEFTVSANILPEIGYDLDIPVILESVQMQDTYEADFQQRRALIYNMAFVVKGFLFGPTTNSGVIKQANVQFYVDTTTRLANTHPSNVTISSISTANVLHSRTTTTPGLTSDGLPTSNATLSVSTDQIKSTDNYGFITNFEEFFDGDGTG